MNKLCDLIAGFEDTPVIAAIKNKYPGYLNVEC